MTYDNTDERGEDAVARQRGGSEPGHLLIASHASDCDLIVKRPFAMMRGHVCTCGVMEQRGGSEPGHLPECLLYPHDDGRTPGFCICDLLRACEARVREDERDSAQRILIAHGAKTNLAGYSEGHAAALDAARDAVAALCPCDHRWGECVNDRAIYAIDALRGGS